MSTPLVQNKQSECFWKRSRQLIPSKWMLCALAVYPVTVLRCIVQSYGFHTLMSLICHTSLRTEQPRLRLSSAAV